MGGKGQTRDQEEAMGERKRNRQVTKKKRWRVLSPAVSRLGLKRRSVKRKTEEGGGQLNSSLRVKVVRGRNGEKSVPATIGDSPQEGGIETLKEAEDIGGGKKKEVKPLSHKKKQNLFCRIIVNRTLPGGQGEIK